MTSTATPTRTRRTPAADAFRALGIPETDWTPTMLLAVKQKWSGLRTDDKVADLRAALAAVPAPTVPSDGDVAAALVVKGVDPVTPADIAAEKARLKRNAGVSAWRERKQLEAAIEARDLKFAALRAKRGTRVAAPAAADVSGDAAPVAVAS